ncbi:MAG TPA: ABC transporter permease [Bacteroidales bacterium]|nr:ABC transporter permease [Bacteroidales bacterium]
MNNFKISFRNLWENRSTSAVNLIGLTVALTSVTFIAIWVHHELSFDKFNKNYENIYMVASEWKYSDGKSDFIMETPTPLGPYLKENFPEVIQSTRFEKQFGGRFLETDNKKFLEQGYAIEHSFFDVFTVDFVSGDSKAIMNRPNSILISQRLAKKFFGKENPLNKPITFFTNSEETKQYEVCGVYKNIPDNSSLQYDFLIPISIPEPNNWFAFGESTFLLLPNEIDKADLNKKIARFYNYDKLGFDIEWYLHSLKDMHFHSDFQQFVYHPGSIQYVYIFTISGIFILLIAVLNFISLVSVLSANRLKESGIRKIFGASKRKIVFSFLTEPFILVSLSLIFTFLLIEIFQSLFNRLSDSTFISFYQNSFFIFALVLMGMIIASISGILPGVFIANFELSDALKQKKKFTGGSYQKYLIALQFTLAIVLMSSTFLIYKQLNYIFRKDLGFKKENIIHVPLKGKMEENFALMKQKLLTEPNVEQVTNGSPIFSSGVEFPGWTWDGVNKDEKHSIASIQADHDFMKTFNLVIVQGQYFSENNSNNNKVIINEEAAKVMNMGNPVSQHMQLKNEDYEIIGVVKNFHSRHFSHEIRPLMITYSAGGPNLYIRYIKDNVKAKIIALANDQYDKFNPEFPFEYQFFADEFEATYRNEQKMLNLLSYFVVVAVLILCFGLYGLSKQVALSRTKEIGIRKVNGAKTSEILTLLNNTFIKWVIIAFFIATPIAFYAMQKWLENFAYRTTLSWWIFALAGVLAMGIALLTVSWQSWRAARMNPVEALRYE